MTYIVDYTSAPSPEKVNYLPFSAVELEALLPELQSGVETADTEWGRQAAETDAQACRVALALAEAGLTILVGEDDDGPYFAIAN